MLKRFALTTLLLISTPIATANAQGFLFGVMAGGMMFGGKSQHGGGNQYSGGEATILYTASEEIMKDIDPLAIRQVASRTCFANKYSPDGAHRSLGELFADLTKERGQEERVILQIARVFYPDAAQCASIWFSYYEKKR